MARDKRKRNAKKFHGKRILIVEDHSLISETLINLLKPYSQPYHAHTGSDALQQIEKQAPDLILLDLTPSGHARSTTSQDGPRKRKDKLNSNSGNERQPHG